MKETLVLCVSGLILFLSLFAAIAMTYSNKLTHNCTVAGMIAGYNASEIRAICNVK